MEIHSAAKLYVVQVRSLSGTGARSALKSGLFVTSAGRDESACERGEAFVTPPV
jgi:hypothetical protein